MPFFKCVQQAQQCERVVEKTPIHYKFLPEIQATFPGARHVWIHRHPLDVYASYRRRGLDEQAQKLTPTEGARWLAVTPEDFIARYQQGITAMREAVQRNPSGHYVLSYEALVKDPETVFTGVCDFLSIPFEEQCVQGGDQEVNDPRDPFLSKPIQNKTKNWMTFVSPEEAEQIQNALAEEFEFLQYPRYECGNGADA